MRFNYKITPRWMGRSDIYRVLEIERWCFDHPWSHDDFVHSLRNTNYRGIVADLFGEMAGYMVYYYDGPRVHLVNLGVDPKWQRCTIATQMIDKLKEEMDKRQRVVIADVRESNLNAQLFFKEMGFLVESRHSIIRQRFDNDEDGYRFVRRPEAEEVKTVQTKEGVRWGR